MVRQIKWTYKAQLNRKEILLYWKNRNKSVNYSIKLNVLFKKAAELLASHPATGRKTSIEGVRVKLVRDYLLFYTYTNDELVILTIWDSRRNPETNPYPLNQ